ncbi:MAG: hypothetical protein AAB454_01585 [Patescibacteria group bacterium]
MRAFFIVFPILALIGLVIFHSGWAIHFPFHDAGVWMHPLAGILLALFFSLGLRFTFFGSAGWIILAAVGWEIFEFVYYIGRLDQATIKEALKDVAETVIPGITILFVSTISKGNRDDHD